VLRLARSDHANFYLTQGAIPVPQFSRSVDRGQGQADVPAEQPTPRARSRLPSPDADPCGSRYRFRASPQGPRFAHRLIPSRELGVLPEPYRLRRHSDFSEAVRRGRRQGRRDLVVHAYVRDRPDPVVSGVDGPRFGLVVSKAVGPAVIRHRVARRLRHICIGLVDAVPEHTDVVLRALPGAAAATSRDLERQIRSGLTRLGLLDTPPDSAPAGSPTSDTGVA